MIGELVRDETYSTMWRVVMPSGDLSDLLNHQRAVELSRLLMLEESQRKWTKGRAA